MIKVLAISILLSLACVFGIAQISPLISWGSSGPGTCSPPSVDHRWVVSDSSTSCGGACSDGSLLSTVSDLVGSNTLTTVGTGGGGQITYHTNKINGLAAAFFFSGVAWASSSAILQGPTSLSLYGVVNPNDHGVVNPLFGTDNTSTNAAVPEYRIEQTSGFQGLDSAFTIAVGTGNVAVPAPAWSTIAVTYTVGGAWNFYSCSGGTCVTGGSGTSSVSFNATNSTNRAGFSQGDGTYQGYIAELGAKAGIISTSSLASYSLCKYGI